jgi:hypothetical protein
MVSPAFWFLFDGKIQRECQCEFGGKVLLAFHRKLRLVQFDDAAEDGKSRACSHGGGFRGKKQRPNNSPRLIAGNALNAPLYWARFLLTHNRLFRILGLPKSEF